MLYLLFSTVPEDGLMLSVGAPYPTHTHLTKAYTMLVPKFEKHPLFFFWTEKNTPFSTEIADFKA